MPTLLHLDSSPMYGHSVSRELTQAFADQWSAAHPGAAVIRRDLAATDLRPLDAAWIGANSTPADKRTPEQQQVLALSDVLVAELVRADEYVLGVPMHNFSAPATFKLWIDQVSRVGVTFSYADGTPKGLLTGKKATFLIATGGQYGPETQMASFNFVEPYLRSVFAFWGVTETTFLTAGGTIALNYGQDRNAFLQPHLEAVQLHAQHA